MLCKKCAVYATFEMFSKALIVRERFYGRTERVALRRLILPFRHLIRHPVFHLSVILSKISPIYVIEMACPLSSFMMVSTAGSVSFRAFLRN
jgi:hypothetical protein